MNPNDTLLERDRLRVVIATILINVIAVSLLTFVPWSDWRTGTALNFVDNCLLVGFAVVRHDKLLARLLLFGIVVGLTELAADAWLVDYTRTLDYSIGGGPMIWRSHCWRELFVVVRGVSPLPPVSLAEHRFLFATLWPF